jgi:23S rRNA (uracil1939-C5)-methyltransferase
VNPGSDIRLTIGALDDEGAGVGVADADAPTEVHISGALPGENVSAHVDHVSSHRPVAWASLQTIHTTSPNRVAPTCRAYGSCGGCVLQHCAYDAQLAWKESIVREGVAAEPRLAGTRVNPAVRSPVTRGYRNNAKLVPGYDREGRVILGAYAPRTHAIIDLDGCTIVEPALDQGTRALTDALNAANVAPYDEQSLAGTLRYAILRANAAGQILVTLVTASDGFPGGDDVVAHLQTAGVHLAGVVQNVNPTRGNAIYGDRSRTMWGTPHIDDQLGDVRLRLSSGAFFQANRHVATSAYAAIVHGLAPTSTDHVVDAYAGVGGIALTLARACRSVTGIESHAGAVDDATASAHLNDITNARFVVGDVSDQLDTVRAADIVVLNPPRKGCAQSVLQRTAALQPRAIAYLSCAPPTLLRDLILLADMGYRTRDLTPFDMLPHTPHIEALALLTR